MAKSKHQLYEISWRDASSASGWKKLAAITDEDLCHYEVKTVGYLVRENKDYYLLAQSMSNYQNVDNRFQIPKKWITKVKKIKGSYVEYKDTKG